MLVCERCARQCHTVKYRRVSLKYRRVSLNIEAPVCELCWKGNVIELMEGIESHIKYHSVKIKEYRKEIKRESLKGLLMSNEYKNEGYINALQCEIFDLEIENEDLKKAIKKLQTKLDAKNKKDY